MARNPKGNVADLDDPEHVRTFLDSANTAVTAQMNQTPVASQPYLAKKTRDAGEWVAGGLEQLAQAMQAASGDHVKALQEARTSEAHARGLK